MADHKDWVAMKPKLRRAFAALKKIGIRAETNFSISLSNGIAEIYDPKARGYAFYHSQDHDGARETGKVSIAVGSFTKPKRSAAVIAIGNEVRDALVEEGLHVEWDGSAKARPVVYASTESFEAQHAAMAASEQDEAALDAEHERVLPAWLEAVRASDFGARLTAAAVSLDNSFWLSHFDYFKAEKKHDAQTKKLNKVRIGLPIGKTIHIHSHGAVCAKLDNVEAYKNKFALRDFAAACRKQRLVVVEEEVERNMLWLDVTEWKPSSTPTRVTKTSKTKPRSKAKAKSSKAKSRSSR